MDSALDAAQYLGIKERYLILTLYL
jgi:hypothetical protein